jgi:hypothetical protein
LRCNDLPHLTHISVQDNCKVECDNSPIAGHNNNLYLSYINTRRSIITAVMDKSYNYEKGIVSMIAGYL